MRPSFWEVARRPKWVAGFVAAVVVSIVFILLMQWQLSRTFNVVGVAIEQREPVPISELTTPGYFAPFSFDRQVFAQIEVDGSSARVIADRIQLRNGEPVDGYWVIANSFVDGASLTVAVGFSDNLDSARDAAASLKDQEVEVFGYIQPTEGVKPTVDGELSSVALGQLLNLYFTEPVESYPVFLILKSGVESGLEPISIEVRQQEIEINWLTAFYAAEWAFFALAAFYVWWRMVQDARLREAELRSEIAAG